MHSTADIVITDRHGRLLALVDVKNMPGLSIAEALGLRDDLLEQIGEPAKYVLVVSQRNGFIWRREDQKTPFGDPESLDMRLVLREYLTEAELSRHIRGAGLELVLSHWLGDLARGRATSLLSPADRGPFSEFVSDIRGAQVNLQALA